MSKWEVGFDALGLGTGKSAPVPGSSSNAPLPNATPNARSARRRKILKWIAFIVAGLALLLALLLSAFSYALSHAPAYRAQVQAWVSERTKLDIQFTHMGASLRYYGPELVFDNAVVFSHDGQRKLVSARRVRLGYDVWAAIGTLRLAAVRATLEQPALQVIRTTEGRIEIVGQSDLPERDPAVPFDPDAIPTGRLQVVDASLSFRDFKTGRGPWIVPDVSFDLRRSGRSMHIDGASSLPAKLGKSLSFTADTAGRLAAAGELQWKFNIEAHELDLAGWAELSPKDWPAPVAGRGSFTVSGIFEGVTAYDLSAKVNFSRVALSLPTWQIPLPEPAKLEAYVDSDEPASTTTAPAATSAVSDVATTDTASTVVLPRTLANYDRIGFDLQLTRARNDKGNTWYINIKDIELARPNSPWRPSAFSATVTQPIAGGIGITAQSDLLVLDNLWPLLAYAPESTALAHVRALNAVGRISELQMNFGRSAVENSPLTYSLHARVSGLSIQAIAKAPGITNFSGVIEGSDTDGRLELNVRDGALDMPRFFRTPLPAERIAGTLQWSHDAAGWHIDTNELLIDSPDGHARASGEVLLPADGSSPQVNVRAQGWDLVAHATPRYLPANKLSPKALAWLDRAFVTGGVPQADFEMHGPVHAFPFRNDEGLFLIKARVTGLTLDYQPGWLPATNLVVDAEFRNAGMTATLVQGEVQGLPIAEGVGRIVDFKQAQLDLNAKVKGSLGAALSYVQQSPIGPAIGAQFMALHGTGSLQGQVELHLPFKDIEKRKLDVNAKIVEGVVSTKELTRSIDKLSGTLEVRDHALYSIDLHGNFLDGPVAIQGGVEGRYTGRGAGLLINAQGNAQAVALADLAHLPTSISLSGAMQWKFSAHAPRHAPDDPAQPTYSVDSDTKGLSISLPAPLGKNADESRALHVEVDATHENALLLRGAFGDVRTLIRLQKGAADWSLDRGSIRADAVTASLPANPGLLIEGTIDRFVLDDWLKLKSDQPGTHQLSDYLRAANVRINSFEFLGFSWPSVRAILQATDDAWRVDVAGDDIAGQLSIPYRLDAGAPLRVALTKLNVGARGSTALSASGKENGATDPRNIPAISGHVDQFSLSGRNVGMADFALDKVSQGVKLTRGELRGDSFTALASGSWLANSSGGSNSSLNLDVTSHNVSDTLHAFNFRDLMTGKAATAHAALTWPGGIDEELLGRASGKVTIDISDGQLLKVDPSVAGRMLGLMSINALARRLTLDFKDVTDKGMSFDKVHGDFELNDGDALTNNLLLSGPQADVVIVGHTNLRKHDYDLTAVAAGDIGGSLTAVGTFVGGPVLGAAVLAFSRIFKQPLKGVARRYYHIGGTWENPVTEAVDREEAKQNQAQADVAVSESQKGNAEGATPAPSATAPDGTAVAPSPSEPPQTNSDQDKK